MYTVAGAAVKCLYANCDAATRLADLPYPGANMLIDPIQGNIEFTSDSLADVAQNLADQTAVLIDVRSEDEWNAGHIRGAVFLPVTALRENADAPTLATRLPVSTILYTYCRVGLRAKVAALILRKHGYEVRPLEPGFDDLVEAGFPVEGAEMSA